MQRSRLPSRASLDRLLLGTEREITRRALLLAVGYFVAISGFTLVLSSVSYGAVPDFVYGFRHAYLIESDVDLWMEVRFTTGHVIVLGFAATHAYLNEGYLPSLILATAPIYATLVFTVPGPVTGIVVPVTEDTVFAPHWAARHVIPNTLAYGTIGFLLGSCLRYLYRRATVGLLPAKEERI